MESEFSSVVQLNQEKCCPTKFTESIKNKKKKNFSGTILNLTKPYNTRTNQTKPNQNKTKLTKSNQSNSIKP